MASVQDLKRRVRSVKNTRKITKAMELVASARLRRAQTRIEAMRPYAETMRELIAGVGRASASVRGLPLLQQRDEVTNVAIVPLTGDRGLAGPFNAQILRRAFALERQLRGEGAAGALPGRRQEGPLDPRVPPLRGGRRVRRLHRPARVRRRAGDRAPRRRALHGRRGRPRDPLYNAYVSPLVQRVTEQDVLPISADILETDEEERRDDAMRGDFIFEPEPEEILERLLPVYLETQIYRALLESAASEQGARMTAMRNASKNAGELIDSLTLQMNRARQAEITQEILEVVAGAEALA